MVPATSQPTNQHRPVLLAAQRPSESPTAARRLYDLVLRRSNPGLLCGVHNEGDGAVNWLISPFELQFRVGNYCLLVDMM